MKKPNLIAVLDLLSAFLLLAWFFLPLQGGAAKPFYPWGMPFTWNGAAAALGTGPGFAPGLAPGFLLFYLVPLYGLWRFTAFFTVLGKKPHLGPSAFLTGVTRIAAALLAAVASVLPALTFADSAAWFAAQVPLTWVSGGVAFAVNILSAAAFLSSINERNPVYLQYREFRRDAKKQVLDPRQEKGKAFLDVFFRIRSKLLVAFIGIISVIILILSVTLLGNYRTTILKAVGDGARTQVEQAAAAYRVNLGDTIAMGEYVNRQVELNKGAEFEYHDLAIYTNLKKEVYLDQEKPEFPDYRAEFSTLFPASHFPDLPALPGAQVASWFSAAGSGSSRGRVTSVENPADGTVSYMAPIVKIDTVKKGDDRVRRERLLGFSVITYDRTVIMRPYFKTRVTVSVITLFFIYLSVALTYLIGNYIVNPLLFLRMSVRKISDLLAAMMRGETRVAASTLVYNDYVTSRDEIKSLSAEINDMVSVIRGIVPYISASTLKNAESGAASTSRKELAFLFTDIRGFTTLCEGMQPEEVVTILNRYLDLETEIILNNHGDVDKFVGDEMMAFFEGPLKEVNACRAAMEIRHAMMEEKERREKEGLPVVSIGIGINVGPVVFGSVGARDRMDFTSIGDTVNLAARLEGANKAYGSKSLITEAVYEKVKDEYLCREIDMIAVKGKNEPVRIFEILQEKPKAQPKLMEIKNHFEKGLSAYRRCDWKAAEKQFAQNVELFKDAPSGVYLERVRVYAKDPPPDDWDGVFRMTVK